MYLFIYLFYFTLSNYYNIYFEYFSKIDNFIQKKRTKNLFYYIYLIKRKI